MLLEKILQLLVTDEIKHEIFEMLHDELHSRYLRIRKTTDNLTGWTISKMWYFIFKILLHVVPGPGNM